MRRLMKTASSMWTVRHNGEDEAGQGLAEYGLILALVALVCIGALGALGTSIASSPGFTLF